jgi:ABC-type branched-subunit amino acid transport system ATPase component
MKNAIEIKNLTKKFNGFTAVDGINLEIKEGELFGLLGPNGAGKTTALNMFPLWLDLAALAIMASVFVLIGSYAFRKSTI